MKHWPYVLTSIVGIVALLALPIITTRAAEFRADRSDETITISDSETPRDLYTASRTVTVNGNVSGDLVAAGGTILINGSIEDNLFAAAGDMTIRGPIGRHLRAAGGTITISSLVDGDVFVAGGTVEITKDAVINGGLYVSGGTVTVAGIVKGEAKVSGGDVTLNGQLASAHVRASTLHLGQQAVINGDLWYKSPEEKTQDQGAVVLGNQHYQAVTANYMWKKLSSVEFLLGIVASILLGWLLWRFAPKTVEQVVTNGLKRPGAAAWLALGTLFITPLVAILLLVTVIGAPIGLLLGLLWGVTIILGTVISKIIFGSWLMRLVTKEKDLKIDLQTIAVGALLLALTDLIPVVGPLVSFVFFLLGLGAVAQLFRRMTDKTLAS